MKEDMKTIVSVVLILSLRFVFGSGVSTENISDTEI